ncbi:MAG: Hpt domain-containing protein [Actinomycetota bacterium]|nr:Hpt domain-containing protein [Actinomycetota bacterium]
MDSLDQEVLDRLARDMGGESAVTRIIAMYLGKLPGEREQLRSSLDTGDLARLADDAHRIKSSTAMLGATRLAGLMAELETAAKSGDAEASAQWMKQIEDEIPRVETAMKARTA